MSLALVTHLRIAPATGALRGWGLDPTKLPDPRTAWQVLRMTIHGRDGDGTPHQLSMSKKERTGTFAVRDGLNASAMVVYDYGKVCGDRVRCGGGGRGDKDELNRVCLQTAAGGLQVLASPHLLCHPHGQGQHPGVGRCHRDLPASAGGCWISGCP